MRTVPKARASILMQALFEEKKMAIIINKRGIIVGNSTILVQLNFLKSYSLEIEIRPIPRFKKKTRVFEPH